MFDPFDVNYPKKPVSRDSDNPDNASRPDVHGKNQVMG
jgi:hypothetical protein